MRQALLVGLLAAALLLSCGGGSAVVRSGPSAPADALCQMCHPSSSGACLDAGYCRGSQAECEPLGCVTVRTPARPCREIAQYCEPAAPSASPSSSSEPAGS